MSSPQTGRNLKICSCFEFHFHIIPIKSLLNLRPVGGQTPAAAATPATATTLPFPCLEDKIIGVHANTVLQSIKASR